DERGALIERQPIERLPDEGRRFLARQQAVRWQVAGVLQVSRLPQMILERHLRRAMTAAPPALPVARLVDDDAIDPGAKSGLAAEAADGAEDPQEDFL